MWRSLRVVSLVASLEMPHAEKNFSYHVHDSSIEPCLKKSRSDYSSSWAKSHTDVYKEHDAESEKWSFSTGSEQRYHPSNRYESEAGRGYKDVRHDGESYLPLRHQVGQGDANKRDCDKNYKGQFVLSGRENRDVEPDVAFSGTSSSFIGPLARPLPKEKSVSEVTKAPNAASSFTIATVELGKSASQSKGQNGMDYELRQFYKELDQLEAEADDQTKPVTHSDVNNEQSISPYPDKIPAMPPANHHHGQVLASQPFGQLPNAATNFASLTCHVKEEQRPPLPLNQFSYAGQPSYPPTNFLFGGQSMPPPKFEGPHPPTFIVPYGPPPPRFNYPMTFPRQSNLPPPPQPSQNFTCNARNERPPWSGSPVPPWSGSSVPPESWFTSREIPHNKPFSQDTCERTWKDPNRSDLCRPEDGRLGERISPPMDNAPHEPYRFRDKKVMVLLRGVPGSGKTTLARTLLRQAPDGIVLSTDDYFCQENGYTYDVKLLGDAHSWNQNRARRAMDDGCSPVIIDNTNIQSWEMKPYVQMAIDRRYYVEFLEPDTWWKQDAHELEKRNTHRVPRDKISQMLERFEYDMTVPVVMNSVEPRHVRPSRPPPEARQRTPRLKEKRHRERYLKKGRKMASRKHSVTPQEDEGLVNLAAEDLARGCNLGDCIVFAEAIGKGKVKLIYSGKEGYLFESALSTHCSNLSTLMLFRMVSRLKDLLDSPFAKFPETQIRLTHEQCFLTFFLLSLLIGSNVCKGTNQASPFLRWFQACSKDLHATDQVSSRGQDILAGLDLYCCLITLFAEQTLRLRGMKCFKLQNVNFPKNRLHFSVGENQDEESKKKCERLKDLHLWTDIREQERVQITDRTKTYGETKPVTPGHHKRRRKIYKLAPTFQRPRILSEAQITTWKNGCGEGAGNLYTATDAAHNHPIGDLTSRDRSGRARDARVAGIYEAHIYPVTSKCSDGPENLVVTRPVLQEAQSCAQLCLPEEFARQIVKLFGCPGVELDAFKPKDFNVPLQYDLAQKIYLKWKRSLEIKYKSLPAK